MSNMYAKAVVVVGIVLTVSLVAVISPIAVQSANGVFGVGGGVQNDRKAPITTSGNNVYVSWPSNSTGNSEIMFRASTDNGKTFGEKTNVSNSTGTDSVNQEISAAGNNLYISWWEVQKNGTMEPVLRVSNDNGKTFGEKIILS